MKNKVSIIEALGQKITKQSFDVVTSSHLEPNLGNRKTMEDYLIHEPDLCGNGKFSLFAVLDGHGGHEVAEFFAKHFPAILARKLEVYEGVFTLEDCIMMSLDNIENQLRMLNKRETGSTFCAILLDNFLNEMYIINIGDSQALQVACEADNRLSGGFLCKAHKTSNFEEVKRITMNGGTVFNGRVGGYLMVTRSLGDFGLKKYGVISTPEIQRFDMDGPNLVVLASDGIWDVIKTEDVMSYLVKNQNLDCEDLGKLLIEEAVKKGSLDNISVICILIA